VVAPDVSTGYVCTLTYKSLFGFRSGPQLQQVCTFVMAAFELT